MFNCFLRADHSWEGFSACEKWVGMSWTGNKAVALLWTVGLEGLWAGGTSGWASCRPSSPPHHHHHLIIFSLLLVPSQNGPTSVGQRPKPLSNNNIGEKKLQLNSGEEERKRVIRWLLWECWKLRFPEALGIPHWSWNLWARKTRPESHQSGDVI